MAPWLGDIVKNVLLYMYKATFNYDFNKKHVYIHVNKKLFMAVV